MVLNAGARLTSQTWRPLVGPLSGYASVLTFDRPGLGRSEPAPPPRSPSRIASELNGLLQEVGANPPFLLVGHSAGGYHMLRYAIAFPDRVAGVVLVDTPHPDFEEQRLKLLGPDQAAAREDAVARSRAAAPEPVQQEYAGAELDGELDFSGFPQDVPLVVIAANGQEFGSPSTASEHRRLWIDLQAQWLELSRRSELIVAEGSGHMVHWDQPELVLNAVRSLLPGGR